MEASHANNLGGTRAHVSGQLQGLIAGFGANELIDESIGLNPEGRTAKVHMHCGEADMWMSYTDLGAL